MESNYYNEIIDQFMYTYTNHHRNFLGLPKYYVLYY